MDKSAMNKTLPYVLLRATYRDYRSSSEWHRTINTIVDELRKHLRQDIELDPEPVCNEHGFSMWLFAEEPDDAELNTIWSGVLSGRFMDETGLNIVFHQFIFDYQQKSRIRGTEGDHVLHVLRVKGENAEWVNAGWQSDDYDEWDDVPFPAEDAE